MQTCMFHSIYTSMDSYSGRTSIIKKENIQLQSIMLHTCFISKLNTDKTDQREKGENKTQAI